MHIADTLRLLADVVLSSKIMSLCDLFIRPLEGTLAVQRFSRYYSLLRCCS